jgi:cholesterol transport system auxiliary component
MNQHDLFRHREVGWRAVLMLCLLFAAGCSMGGRSPADTRAFLLQIDPPAEGSVSPSLAVPLKIRNCRVAAPFAGRSLVYRLTAVQYQYDSYNAFLVPLSDQLDDALYRWLQVDIGALAQADQTLYTLEPALESLVADFMDPNRPTASARMRFVLTRSGPDSVRPSVVFQKSLIAKVQMPINKPTAEQVVAAFSVCIHHILTQLRGELVAVTIQQGKKVDAGTQPLAKR